MYDRSYQALEAKDYERAEEYADLVDEITRGRNESSAKVRVLISKGRRYEKNSKI